MSVLTIIYYGKNDNYCNDFTKRMKLTIQKQINNIFDLNSKDMSILLVDWGSDYKNNLFDAININLYNIKFRYIYVPYDICIKYKENGLFSLPHASNIGLRNSTTNYVMFSDAECYMQINDTNNLIKLVKNYKDNNVFYLCSRKHISPDIHTKFNNINDVDNYINNNNISVSRADIKNGGYSGLLLGHKKIFYDCTGYWEKLIYSGWLDGEIHIRLLQKYKCGGDLIDQNINCYHFHHDIFKSHNEKHNPHITTKFKANNKNWGLNDENLIIKDYNN